MVVRLDLLELEVHPLILDQRANDAEARLARRRLFLRGALHLLGGALALVLQLARLVLGRIRGLLDLVARAPGQLVCVGAQSGAALVDGGFGAVDGVGGASEGFILVGGDGGFGGWR